MTMFPDVITIINTVNNKGIKTYNYTVVSGVLFENTKRNIQKEYGVDDAGSKMCYIPLRVIRDIYVDEVTYKSLSDEAKPNYVTLQKGDYIVNGIATGVDVNDLYNTFNEVLKITSVDYLLRGSLEHFEVMGA